MHGSLMGSICSEFNYLSGHEPKFLLPNEQLRLFQVNRKLIKLGVVYRN